MTTFNANNKLTSNVPSSLTQEQLGVIVGKARTTVGDILTLNKLPQEIRDECRGDRQISRSTLIDIARKKLGARDDDRILQL